MSNLLQILAGFGIYNDIGYIIKDYSRYYKSYETLQLHHSASCRVERFGDVLFVYKFILRTKIVETYLIDQDGLVLINGPRISYGSIVFQYLDKIYGYTGKHVYEILIDRNNLTYSKNLIKTHQNANSFMPTRITSEYLIVLKNVNKKLVMLAVSFEDIINADHKLELVHMKVADDVLDNIPTMKIIINNPNNVCYVESKNGTQKIYTYWFHYQSRFYSYKTNNKLIDSSDNYAPHQPNMTILVKQDGKFYINQEKNTIIDESLIEFREGIKSGFYEMITHNLVLIDYVNNDSVHCFAIMRLV